MFLKTVKIVNKKKKKKGTRAIVIDQRGSEEMGPPNAEKHLNRILRQKLDNRKMVKIQMKSGV